MESKLRDLIAAEARTYTRAGGTIRSIRDKTGLSHSTIVKIIYSETRFPRAHTLLTLLEFFGYEIEAKKIETRLKLVK